MKKIWIIGLLGIGMCSSCQESYQEKFIRIAQAENAACPRRLNELPLWTAPDTMPNGMWCIIIILCRALWTMLYI